MRPYVAIVDDEPDIRRLCCAIAELRSFQTGVYQDGVDFFDRYVPQPGCIVLGIGMPRLNGVRVLEEMQRRAWQVPTIAMSGAFPDGGPQRLLDLGAVGLVQKPFKVAELLDWIERAVTIDGWHRREQVWTR